MRPGAIGVALDGVMRAIDLAVCLMLAIIVMIGGVELVARNLFNHSFVWAHEVTMLLGNWVYFLGICIVYDHRGDVTMSAFTRLLRGRARTVWAVTVHLASAFLFAVIAWYGWELIKLQAPFRSTGLGVPNPAFSAPVAIGAVVLVLLCLRHAATDLRGGGAAPSAGGIAPSEPAV